MKTVMLFGTFDILHAGHLSLFKQAKEHGDHITAVVARDARVKQIKGELPVHNEQERKEILESVTHLDDVLLGSESNVYELIFEKKPDVIVLGYDQQAFTQDLQRVLDENNMNTQIVRLKPFKQDNLKSGKIKEQLQKMI